MSINDWLLPVLTQMPGYKVLPKDGYVAVITPILYSDDDCVEIFLREHNGVIQISDGGETFRKYDMDDNLAEFRQRFPRLKETGEIREDATIEDFGDKLGSVISDALHISFELTALSAEGGVENQYEV